MPCPHPHGPEESAARFLTPEDKEAGDTRLSIVASHGSQIENMRAHPDWEDDESDFIFPDLPEETGLDWAKHREPTVMLAAQIDQYENVVSEFLRSKPQYRHKVVRVWAYAGSIFFLMKLGA